MRFYTGRHAHYCGIDLHARTMYLYILNADGEVVLHRNMPSSPEAFLRAVAPYREGLVVVVECIFTWYWLADLCKREGIEFILGHARHLRHMTTHGSKLPVSMHGWALPNVRRTGSGRPGIPRRSGTGKSIAS